MRFVDVVVVVTKHLICKVSFSMYLGIIIYLNMNFLFTLLLR